MTQLASPEAVRGNFDNVSLELDGAIYRLEKKGDEFWVEMPDPEWRLRQPKNGPVDSNAPRVRRRITMTTGSHHMQAYWVDNEHGNQQYGFPFTYIFEQKRWVPRRSAFMKDPKDLRFNQVWNVGCIDCHSTAGQPRQKEDMISFDTRVAELGIACEACHGPGAKHVAANSDPLRRYALHFRKQGDATIVNPGRVNSKRSSEICGRCHSAHGYPAEKDWLENGAAFRPGENLEPAIQVIRHEASSEARRGAFWNDDMIRVSGREYNGLLKTACFQKGEMSCLSCHSMHQSSPTNQLARSMESNAACIQCHPSFEKNLEAHTHHAAGSSGSLCYNCHMPHTTYGLLKALRSHQITSPSVQSSVQTGRPNACNLCHLDKTLGWTAQSLSQWYKIPAKELSPENKEIAASILWALKGDAGQRALIAWHLGWKPAREISNDSWFPAYLSMLLDDPYPVVRYVAGRSLKRLSGYEDFVHDFIAPQDELQQSGVRAFQMWMKTSKPTPNATLLFDKDGRPESDTVEALLKSRNNRVLELQE